MSETDSATLAQGRDEGKEDTVSIRADGVSKRFGETIAVDDVSFSVAEGAVAAFLGPNGSGKTTLVRLLTGVLSPTGGDISVLGRDVATSALDVREDVGVVTESISLYERFSGRYNLAFSGRIYGVPSDVVRERIDELSEILGFRSYLDDPVESYSTGMKKRLLLARALLHDPDVLFLDEPTNGLDPQAAQSVVEYIESIRRDRHVTVFLCTHNLHVAERLATEIFFLDDGEVVVSGTPAELRSRLWPEVTVTATIGDWSAELERRIEDAPWTIEAKTHADQLDIADARVLELELASRDAIPELVELVVDEGARLYRLEEAEYSLEDIYFRVRGDLR